MAAIDTLAYVKTLEAAGVDRCNAEAQVEAMTRHVLPDLVTKTDLDRDRTDDELKQRDPGDAGEGLSDFGARAARAFRDEGRAELPSPDSIAYAVSSCAHLIRSRHPDSKCLPTTPKTERPLPHHQDDPSWLGPVTSILRRLPIKLLRTILATSGY